MSLDRDYYDRLISRASSATGDTVLLDGAGISGEIIALWNLVAYQAEKIQELESKLESLG